MEQSESECDKSLGSEEDFNLNCQPCYRDGDDVRVHGYCIECEEHLCVTCYKFHRRTVFTRDHTLLDTLSMPRKAVKTVKSPTKSSGQTDACTEECSDHKNKYLEYYCHLHKYLGCSVCVTLNHKQCNSVRFIPDIADKNEVYSTFVQTIDSFSLEFKEIKNVSETNASEARTIHSQAKQDKDGFRKVINSKLDILDDDIDNEMKLVLKEDTKALDDIKEMSDKRIKQLESVLSDIDDKHKVGQSCNVFIAIKRVEDDIVSFTDDLQLLQQRNTIRKYKFKPDDQLLELISGHTIGMLLQPSKCKQECAMGPTNTPANRSDVKCHIPKAAESQCFKDGKPVVRKTAFDRLDNGSFSVIEKDGALNNMKTNACYDLRDNQRPTNNTSISDASSYATRTEYTPDGEQHWNTCQSTAESEPGSADTGKTSDNDVKKRRKEFKTEPTIEIEFNQCPGEDKPSRDTDQERNLHEDVSNISEINAISCQVEGTTDEIVDDAKARTDNQTNEIEEQQLSNGNIEGNPTESFCEEKPDGSFGNITDPEDIKLTDGRNVTDCPNDDSAIAEELNTEHRQLETHANAAIARDTSSLTENIHKSATKSEYNDGSLQQEWELLEISELGPNKVNSQADETSESASPSATSETPAEKHMSTETDAEHEHNHGNLVRVKETAEAEPCLTIHNTTKERDANDVELSEDGNGIPCETNQEASVIKDSLQLTQTHMESLSANVVANCRQLPDLAGSPDVSPKLEYEGNTNVTSGASMTKDKIIETTDTPNENDAETRQNYQTQDEANARVDKLGANQEDIRQNHHSKDDANETTDICDANEAEPRQNHQSQDDANETTGTPDANEAESRQNHRSKDDANETTGIPDANEAEHQQNHHSQDDANETTGTPDANKAEPRQIHHYRDNTNETTDTPDENDAKTRQNHQTQDEANETVDKPGENEDDVRQSHHNQDNANGIRKKRQSQNEANETTDTPDENDADTRQNHQTQDQANETIDKPGENEDDVRKNRHSKGDANKTTDTPVANKAEPRQNHQSKDDANETTGTPDANKAEPQPSHYNQDNANGIREKRQSQDEANETTGTPDENDAETRQNRHTQDEANETVDKPGENEKDIRQNHHSKDDANETTDIPDANEAESRQNHRSQDDANETTGTPDAYKAEPLQNHLSQDNDNATTGTPDANKSEPRQSNHNLENANGIKKKHQSQDEANETTDKPDENDAETRQNHQTQDEANETIDKPGENEENVRQKHHSKVDANETTDKPDENEEDTQQNHHNQDDVNETAYTGVEHDAETRQSHHNQDDANETTDTPDENDTETRQNHHTQDDNNATSNTPSGKIKKITSDARSVNDEGSQTTNLFITIGNNAETDEPNTELGKATAKEKGAQTNNGNANACYDLRGNLGPTNNIIISDASSSANKTECTHDGEQLLNTYESTVQKEHGSADTSTSSDNDLNKSRKELKTVVTSYKHTKAADISAGYTQTDTCNHTQQISTPQTVVSLGPEVAPNDYQLQTQRNSTDENTLDKCETNEQFALSVSTKDDDIDEEMDACNAQHLTMKRKNDMETPKSKRQCGYNEQEYKTSGDNNSNEKPRSREMSQSTGNNTFVEQTKRLFYDKNTSSNSAQRQKTPVTYQLDHQTLATTDGRTKHVNAKSTYIPKGNLAGKEETHEDVQTKKTPNEGATIADGDEVQSKTKKQTKENDPVASRTSTTTETPSNRNHDHTQTNNNATALKLSRRAAQTNQTLYTEASGSETQSATRQVTPRMSSNGQSVQCQQPAAETDRRPIERHNSRETETIEDHTEETIELEHIWEPLFDHFEIRKSLQKRFSVQINCSVTKTHFRCVVSGKANEVVDAIGAFRGEFMNKRVCKAVSSKHNVPVVVFSKTDILKHINKQIKECFVVLSKSQESELLLYTFDQRYLQIAEDTIRRLVTKQQVYVDKLLIDSEDLYNFATQNGVLLIKDTHNTTITVTGLRESVHRVVNKIAAKSRPADTLPECEKIINTTVLVENRNAFAVIKSDNVFLDRLHAKVGVDISPIEFHDKQGFEIKGNSEQVYTCETEIKEYVGKVRSSIIKCGDNRTEMYVRSKDGHIAIDDVAKHQRVLIHCQTKLKRQDQNKGAACDRLGTDLLKVIVEEGSLDKKKADVLVNTTSKHLDLKNGAVSAALLKSSGDEMQKECSRKYPQGVQIGQIATTGGHNLNCKHVFHGSIPNYAGGHEEEKSRQNLRVFVNNCLQEAVMLKQVTIAFPAIGTGNLGYPVDVVADEMFSCVERFKQTCKQMALKHVYFVIYPGDQRAIRAFKDMERRQTNICGGRNTRASNEALPSMAPETLILELQIFGYDTNVESAKSDIEKMLKHDLPKSQSTVYMSLPPEVSELLRQIDQTSGQCYRFKLQQELSDMDVALVDVDKVLEVRASDIDILKEAPRYISKFCYQHFHVSITLKELYHMEEKTYSISSDQYSLFCFYSSDILSRCKKDGIKVFMTGNTLVIEGRLEIIAVAKTRIHQNIDTIEYILYKESINIGNVLEVKNMHNVVDQFQNTTATVCCIFKPEKKSVEFFGHLKYEVEKTTNAFSEHLKEINDRRQHPGNFNVNIGTNINSTNAPLSPMTCYSNAVTNRPKNKDLFTCYTQEQLSVKVYEADIFSVNVDCIVNAANEDLKHVGGIARVIASKAGQDLIKECDNYTKQYGPLPVGRALRTSAGKLHNKCVIHAVGPCWKDYKPITHESIQKCQKDLHDAVWYSLDIANRNHMTSVAFPAISSASFGVPRELCASEFAKSVMMFSKQRFGTRRHTLQEVCFVDTDPKTIQIIKETFSVMIKDQKPCPHSFMQYIVQKPTNPQHGQGSRAPEIPPRNRPHTNVETPNTFSYPLYIMSAIETKCKFTDRHTLRIYTGDILNVRDADTIVCGEDISGSAKGYIAKCLTDVGKWEYVKGKNDAFSNTKPRTGDVVITNGGKSQFERIAHALVPHRQQFKIETEWKKSLRKMYDRIFGETSRAGSFSLILPLLGTGAANADLQTFIEVFLDSYVVACNRHQTNPLTVSIVNIEEHKTRAIVEVFKKHIDKHHNYTSTDVHTDPANDLTRSRTDRHSGSFTPRTGHENIDKYAKGASAARPPGGYGRNGAGADNKQKFAEKSRRVKVDGCVICLDDKINNPKRLICGHTFCKNCIDSHFKVKPVCPTCSTVCGTITEDQPKGQMEIRRSNLDLDGYDLKGSISITYIFPAGKQNSNHPRPGAQYTGLKRTAYLPYIEKGQKICAMLREAFNRKLVFTIGTSRTSGQDGVITWNDIHHKTDMRSNAQYGYPDPKYLARVTDELKANGVTESDIDQNFLRRLKTLNTGQKLHNL